MTVAEAVATSSEAAVTYAWRAGSRRATRISAQDVGDEVAAVAEAHGGICSPRALVDRSRAEDAKLHAEFEWNDAVAGEEYRISQARNLVRGVIVIRDAAPSAAFVHVKVSAELDEDDDGPAVREGYMPVEIAMRDPNLRGQVLSETIGMLSGLRRRLVELQHVQSVVAAIDIALEAARAAQEVEAPPATE